MGRTDGFLLLKDDVNLYLDHDSKIIVIFRNIRMLEAPEKTQTYSKDTAKLQEATKRCLAKGSKPLKLG